MTDIADTMPAERRRVVSWKLARQVAIEIGPLLVFFFTYSFGGISFATGVFLAVLVLAVAANMVAEGKLPLIAVASLALALVFGGLTLWLDDPRFIQMRPTAVNLFYALLFGASALAGRPLLVHSFGAHVSMSEAGWRAFTRRMVLFLVASAILNEIVWRVFGTDVWVAFKVFVQLPLGALFLASQIPLVRAHRPG